MVASRIPGMGSSKGPKRALTPSLRPEFVMGSRPDTLRAPKPGQVRIKPTGGGTRDYGKISPGPGVGTFSRDEGPL